VVESALSTRKVRYFIAIAKSGSFSAAARVLGIAQSALSRHVADLEASIGAPLLERTGRGVELSPIGRIFLEDSERLLAQFDRTFEQLRIAATNSSGRLTIALNAVTARFPAVLVAITSFAKKNPDVDLRLPIMRSAEQIAQLRDLRIDAGFLMEPAHGLSELSRYSIGHDGFRVALSREHSLFAQPVLSFSDLEGHPCILISADSLWTPQSRILQQCHSYGFRPKVRMEVASQQLQLDLIDRNLGYGFVNASVQAILSPNIVLRRVAELRDRLELDFVYFRNRHNRLIDLFRIELVAAVTEAENEP
jgi:LysR family transcriptional regulator, benzoate and cis,cis-muconate-responsive activator of ben and cat genes